MARKRMSFYTEKELKDNVLSVRKKEQYNFIPNETFKDLTKAFAEVEDNTSTHIAYAFSYLYLISYQWRYAKYYTSEGQPINEAMIKNVLGFGKGQTYNYITKKGGLLEQLGYIKKVSDKPAHYDYEDEYGENAETMRAVYGYKINKETVLYMESETGKTENTRNWKVSMPVKMYDRFNGEYEEADTVGTLDEVDYTVNIPINIFMYCMANEEIGVEGFYLYSYLKSRCDVLGSYDCSRKRFVRETGMSVDMINDMLVVLEKHNMIDNDHKPYVLNKPANKTAFANTYKAKKYDVFAKSEAEFNTIPELKKVDKKRYELEYGWVEDLYETNDSDEVYEVIDGKKVNKETGEVVEEIKFDNDKDELPEEFRSGYIARKKLKKVS